MANIKKSFNFRNGVQVDDDNLLVTSTGLVAIGKTIPTEALDVIGNVVVSGVTSSVEANIGLLTATTFNPTEIIGAGVSISSGIITNPSMDATGIVTYYGDGQYLQNLPTSQLTTVGGGNTNIFIIPSVGIGTTNPQFNFQVGNDVNSGASGVGISSDGNIKASGIVSATTFVGNLTGDTTGNVTGNLTGLVNSAGISTFAGINATGRIVGAAVSNVIPFFYSNFSDLPSPVTYHGAFAHVHSTGRGYYAHGGAWIELVNKDTSGNVALGNDLDVDGHTNLDNVSVAGVTTFAGNIDVNADIDVDGHTELDNVNIAGVSTFNEARFANDKRLKFGDDIDLQIYHFSATDNNFISAANNADLTISAREVELMNQNHSSYYFKGAETGSIVYHNNSQRIATTDTGVVITGVATATELNSPLIGVGTNAPANDIQVRKSGNTEIQVTSDTGTAGITVGREPATANTNNAEFRYGLVSGGAPYSSAQSLDILNYGTGNFNYNISANNSGAIAGDFHWHKGLNNTIMTLTGIGGSLGIGITTPSEELHVIGGAIITGNLTANNLNGNLNGTLTGNANVTSGVSTFKNLKVTGITTIGSGNDTVFVNDLGVGIKTTTNLTNVTINASQANASINAVAIGATVLKSAVDFADAGDIGKRFMIPPKVGAAQTASLTGLVSGAMIYNTNLNKLQVYNGTNWETITSVEVTG